MSVSCVPAPPGVFVKTGKTPRPGARAAARGSRDAHETHGRTATGKQGGSKQTSQTNKQGVLTVPSVSGHRAERPKVIECVGSRRPRAALIKRGRFRRSSFSLCAATSLPVIYYRSIGIDESSPQWLTDLLPKRRLYKEVLLLDKLDDEIPTRRLYKFQVNPAHHHRDSTGRGIIMVPGYPSILLATRITPQAERKLRKTLMRDQQTREIQSRNLYDEKDGPKKLRTIR